MSMTDWRAVGTGFAIELVAGVFALLLPGVGHAVAGLIGGFVAGYLAGGGLWSGTWHGLLAGGLGGFVLAAVFGFAVGTLGIVTLGPLAALAGGAVFVAVALVAVVMALDSALAGALGGVLGESRSF